MKSIREGVGLALHTWERRGYTSSYIRFTSPYSQYRSIFLLIPINNNSKYSKHATDSSPCHDSLESYVAVAEVPGRATHVRQTVGQGQ
jgi:hypothetical protein